MRLQPADSSEETSPTGSPFAQEGNGGAELVIEEIEEVGPVSGEETA